MNARGPDAGHIQQMRAYADRVEAVSEMLKDLRNTGIEVGYEDGSAGEVLRMIGVYAETGGNALKCDADRIRNVADEMEKKLNEKGGPKE